MKIWLEYVLVLVACKKISAKTKASCHSRCGKIKIPSCTKALAAEHWSFTSSLDSSNGDVFIKAKLFINNK